MKKLMASISVALLLLMPQLAFAAREPLNWKLHGVIGFAVAVFGAIFWISRQKNIDTVHAKIFAFGIYFWVIIFAEFIGYGFYYWLFR